MLAFALARACGHSRRERVLGVQAPWDDLAIGIAQHTVACKHVAAAVGQAEALELVFFREVEHH